MADTELANFYFNTRANIVKLITFEISHPSFSKVYRIVSNNSFGFTGTDSLTYEFYPVVIETTTSTDDIDYELKFDFGDLGEIIPKEFDRVASQGNFYIKPVVIYREYQSSPNGNPFLIMGPITLEVSDVSHNETGASFIAKAPKVSDTTIGYIYSIDRFPTLREFL